VTILKSAQRTHVTTNACGLLLRHALDPPARGGLGLRRVQWTCDAGNAPSQRTAARLGFKREGTLRWLWILPEGSAAGDAPSTDDPRRGRGRHDIYHSICWDDWEHGTREHVEKQMARRA
jgi:RimJ/RimL family protein N-acetyltransferase